MKPTLAALLMVTAFGCGDGEPTATSSSSAVSSPTESPTSTPDRSLADNDATDRTLSAEEPVKLPATASPMPLVALSGLAALLAGLFLRTRRTA